MRPQLVLANKLDAAQRQIDTAIWLWFNDGDLVSVNTLAGAANGILDALLHDRKMGRAAMFEEVPHGMKPTEWFGMVKEAEDFAKHARHDPEARHLYSSAETSLYLLSVVASYERLAGVPSAAKSLRGLFVIYFAATYPGAFEPVVLQEIANAVNVDAVKKLSGSQFLKRMSVEDKSFVDGLPQFHSGLPPDLEEDLTRLWISQRPQHGRL